MVGKRSFLHLVVIACAVLTAAYFLWLRFSGDTSIPEYDRLPEAQFVGGPTTTSSSQHQPEPTLPDNFRDPLVPPPSYEDEEPMIWKERQAAVKKAYIHALDGYKKNAFPYDELLPVSGGAINKFNGWAVTLLDSIDTMWMMGLQDDYQDAIAVVAAQNFTQSSAYSFAPFFETVIRYLGGLLSAYALTKEPIFLVRADDLGMKLLPAFAAYDSGFPAFSVNMKTGRPGPIWASQKILFAEIASCQMEFKYLAKLTGRKIYYRSAEYVMEKLYEMNVTDGLFPVHYTQDGKPDGDRHSVGAAADSAYEYFLKQWLQCGDVKARDQYLISINGIIQNLFFVSPSRHLLYVTDTDNNITRHTLEHLSCFLPGVLALGAQTLDLSQETKELHMWAAEGLAYTCYMSYVDQASGLGPDVMYMNESGERWVDLLTEWENGGRAGGVPPGLKEAGRAQGKTYVDRDYWDFSNSYLLRPETIESLFVLWRTTGESKWRERGWEIFSAIEKHAKTKFGYASVSFVDSEEPRQLDDMPSYFLAETLKYLYLLFDDGDPYPASEWVFNTEAHPLPVFRWTEAEKKAFGI